MSGNQQGKPPVERQGKDLRESASVKTKGGRQRSSDLGRALRSVYDDTVRENVPDDFLDLLGKLN